MAETLDLFLNRALSFAIDGQNDTLGMDAEVLGGRPIIKVYEASSVKEVVGIRVTACAGLRLFCRECCPKGVAGRGLSHRPPP